MTIAAVLPIALALSGAEIYKVGRGFWEDRISFSASRCVCASCFPIAAPLRHSTTGTMKSVSIVAGLAAILPLASACGSGSSDSCFGPVNHVEHVRHVKRMQPGAQGASYGPTRPLEWGQLNIMHTVRRA